MHTIEALQFVSLTVKIVKMYFNTIFMPLIYSGELFCGLLLGFQPSELWF